MDKSNLDSPKFFCDRVTVQTIGPTLFAHAMDSLLETLPQFCVVHEGGSVVLLIGESGMKIAQKLRMRTSQTNPEQFVLVSDGSPIDFNLVRHMPIKVFVGADEPIDVMIQAISAAQSGSAYCSPQMVTMLIESAQSPSGHDLAERAPSPSENIFEVSAGGDPAFGGQGPIYSPRSRRTAVRRAPLVDEPGDTVTRAARMATALGLTTGEWEVVELAVEGLSNSEISAHLRLSLPTVKYHLYKSYQKLGIRRRSQLASALMIMPVESAIFAANRKLIDRAQAIAA